MVEKAKLSNRTLFAFLSYKDSSSLSTISLLHTFIFQLVANDPDLRLLLCNAFQSRRSDLKGGPTYIVVDGLDEAGELERQMILQELLAILRDTDETKLLISSRLEEDIAKLLTDSAETIRVDHNNAGCIQAYITSRIQQWFNEKNDLDAEAHSEIRRLLAPLSAKAKGKLRYSAGLI